MPIGYTVVGHCLVVCWLMKNNALMQRTHFALARSFETALENALQASRKADSIVNHTLKNTMANTVAKIEVFPEKVDQRATTVHHLQLAAAALGRGMRAYRHRQANVHMDQHCDTSSLQLVNLQTFMRELMAGRQMRVTIPDITLLIDENLCSLIVDMASATPSSMPPPRTRMFN